MTNALGLDQITQEILVNSIVSLLSHFSKEGFKKVRDNIAKNKVLSDVIKDVSNFIVGSIGSLDQKTAKELNNFLGSTEVESIVRQVYAAKCMGNFADYKDFILVEFNALLALHIKVDKRYITNYSNRIFTMLIEGCNEVIQMITEERGFSIEELRKSLQASKFIGELDAINKNLEFLISPQEFDLQSIYKFEEHYRSQVSNRHKNIIPPFFDTVKKIPIKNLYVSPRFLIRDDKKEIEERAIDLSTFLSSAHRTVILGNPGGGKSTFAAKLVYDMSTLKKRIFAGRKLTPIIIVLRDYGAAKKSRNCSILQFIEDTASSTYQLTPPKKGFEYLLLNGRVLVVFDGLDELLDTSYRQEVSGNIESFCTLYPSVPVIVTSREVGYEQAPLDDKLFETYFIAPFNEKAVEEYATKWFALDPEISEDEKKLLANSFLKESNNVHDLRSNPLMLSLMCNLYRGEKYIPKNRPDVYERCSVMLFERWDKNRGIRVSLPFDAHIRPTMMFLAYWIYSNEHLQGGITERQLIEKSAEYLCPIRFDNKDEAESAAKEFINFCRGRAWVFTEVGITQSGEGLYQFTHRTFLEYFTSSYIVRTHATPDDLVGFLHPKIAKREWDIVSQLAVQIQSKNIEGAGDQIMLKLIDYMVDPNNIESLYYLSFAVRCLEFLIPSPRITRQLVSIVMNYWFKYSTDRFNELDIDKLTDREDITPDENFKNLASAAEENQVIIIDQYRKEMFEVLESSEDEKKICTALIIGLCIRADGYSLRNDIKDQYKDRVVKLSQTCRTLSQCAIFMNWLNVKDIVRQYGAKLLFQMIPIYPFSHSFYMVPVIDFVRRLLMPGSLEEDELKYLDNNLELFEIEMFSEATGTDIQEYYVFTLSREDHDYSDMDLPDILINNPKALFGAFMLLAFFIELSGKRKLVIKGSDSPFIRKFRWSLLARRSKVSAENVMRELNEAGFSSIQKETVWKWIGKDINLLAR